MSDTSTTEPTSTIGSINGPATVGPPLVPNGPTTTTLNEECWQIAPGVGQGQWSFFPCDLTSTTVPSSLPSTGITDGPVGMGIAFFLMMAGIALVRLVERRKP